MPRPGQLSCVALAVGTLWAAPAAHAERICVDADAGAACDITQTTPSTSPGARLAAAIAYAAETVADDTIVLGSQVYDQAPAAGVSGTFYYDRGYYLGGRGTLTLLGAGIGQTTLRDSGTFADDETVEGGDQSDPLIVRDLTIEGPPNAPRSLGIELGKAGSLVERVRFMKGAGTPKAGTLQAAILARANVTLRDITISGFAAGIDTRANPVPNPGHKDTPPNPAFLTVERASIDVPGLGIKTTNLGGVFRRVTIRSSAGDGIAAHGPTTIENAVIDAADSAVAADCNSTPAVSATVSMQFVTARAAGAAGVTAGDPPSGTTPAPTNTCVAAARTATITATNSLFAPGTTVTESAGGSISLTHSRWDGGAGITSSAMTTAAPSFVSASDLHLQPTSALIDLGVIGSGNAFTDGDRGGQLRVVDGNGNGNALPDLGAYEVQSGSPGPGPTTPTTPTPTTPTPTTPTPTTPGATTPGPITPFTDLSPPPGSGAGVVVPPPGPAPYLGLGLSGGKVRADRSGRVTVRVACPAASLQRCGGLLQLLRVTGKGKRQRSTTLGHSSVKVKSGRAEANVVITLSKTGRKLLTAGGVKLTLRAITADSRDGAPPVVTTVALTVRR